VCFFGAPRLVCSLFVRSPPSSDPVANGIHLAQVFQKEMAQVVSIFAFLSRSPHLGAWNVPRTTVSHWRVSSPITHFSRHRCTRVHEWKVSFTTLSGTPAPTLPCASWSQSVKNVVAAESARSVTLGPGVKHGSGRTRVGSESGGCLPVRSP